MLLLVTLLLFVVDGLEAHGQLVEENLSPKFILSRDLEYDLYIHGQLPLKHNRVIILTDF